MLKNIDWTKEALQAISEVADVAKDSGFPGISLAGKIVETFYDRYLINKFQDFCNFIELDRELLEKIQEKEDYVNCFYSILETFRRTHSRLGIVTLALLYREYWDKPEILIPAYRAFAEIDDATIEAFIELYDSIPDGEKFLSLRVKKEGVEIFHPLYIHAVELINRNIFVHSIYTSMDSNMPIQGMKYEHTDLYYKWCKEAKQHV
jgi:hypothetical protein